MNDFKRYTNLEPLQNYIGMNKKLKEIKDHMVAYMSSYTGTNDEYYDDDGHCGDGLWEMIKNYWTNEFNTDKDFIRLVSGDWDDDVDLDGARDYIFINSNVIPLLFDYMVNVLGWDKEKYEDNIFNSVQLTDDLNDMFDEVEQKTNNDQRYYNQELMEDMFKEDIIAEEKINKILGKEIEDRGIPFGYDYIPRLIKYHISKKDVLDKTHGLKYIGKSMISPEEHIIYEIKEFGIKIPQGYEVVYPTKDYLK